MTPGALFVHNPKSGGTSIKTMFNGHAGPASDKILVDSHHTASEWKSDLGADVFDALWKFGFVRNPWDRAVSWFFAQKDFTGGFDAWLNERGERDIPAEYDPRRMLCDDTGALAVDTVYRFEDYAESVRAISAELAVDFRLLHVNRCAAKPDGGVDYRDYYRDPVSIEYVGKQAEWEIGKFRYTFDG